MGKVQFRCILCGGVSCSSICEFCGSVIDEYNNLDIYNEICDNYSKIINNEYKISSEYFNILKNAFFNRKLDSNCELSNMLIDILSKKLVEENSAFTMQEKENLFCMFVDNISKKENIPIKFGVLFYDINKERCEGYAAENYAIGLSRRLLETNPIDAYSIVFHELKHVKQTLSINNKIISASSFTILMDKINWEILGQKYYDDNYEYLPSELEAFLFQYDEAFNYFEGINVKIPDELKTKAILHKEFYLNLLNSDKYYYRKVDDIYYPTAYIFSKNIYDKPEYLDKYPQLNFFYKIENGHTIEKTSQELNDDYNKFLSGEIFWNGDKEEINNIYLRSIQTARLNEQNQQKNEDNIVK